MKITPIITLLLLTSATAASAALPADGYYRVKNVMSGRYVYVIDNHGYLDWGATSADLKAIELWKGHENTISDPASVLYFNHIEDSQYDVTAQGTGIHQIIDYYVKLYEIRSEPDTYMLYASKSGMTKYLCDAERSETREKGALGDSGEGKWRYWHLEKIETSGDNYFGITPSLEGADGWYEPFYAAFPYSFSSPGMTALYVSHVDAKHGIAVVKETSGTIPAGTPLIIKCNGVNAADNRLAIGGTASATLSGNCLKGVYFENTAFEHYSAVAYDPATMRIPAILADGKLGFVTSDIELLPRNKSYLTVPHGCAETLQTMTEDEYKTYLENLPPEAGIDSVTAEKSVYDVYNMLGVKVGDTNSTSNLAPGIYIINHKKVFIGK